MQIAEYEDFNKTEKKKLKFAILSLSVDKFSYILLKLSAAMLHILKKNSKTKLQEILLSSLRNGKEVK